jgi:hypothetical protein
MRECPMFTARYRDAYTWHFTQEYNEHAEEAFGKQLGATMLRGDRITRQRPDGHLVSGPF